MKSKTIMCACCGREIIKTRHNKRYCQECAYEIRLLRARNQHRKPKVISSKLSLDEKIKRADELGMSYGKYVQAVERGLIKE